MRIFSSLLGSFVLILAVCFAVTNRQTADVSLWPFDLELQTPVYLLSLGSLFSGVLIGAVITWIGLLPHRLAARRLHKEIARMNDKISELQHSVQSAVPLKISSPFKPKSRWRFWTKNI